MNPQLAWLSALLMAVGLALPIGYYEEGLAYWWQFPMAAMFVAIGIAAVIAGERWLRHLAKGELWAWVGPVAVIVAGIGPARLPTTELSMGLAAAGFWLAVVGVLLLAWVVMQHISALPASRVYALVVPALFGIALVYLWQSVVVGFAVPRILLPAPTEILAALQREA